MPIPPCSAILILDLHLGREKHTNAGGSMNKDVHCSSFYNCESPAATKDSKMDEESGDNSSMWQFK